MNRKHLHFLPKINLKTCSAEDLIITKAFASRDLDWLVIRGILIRQGKTLNWDIIDEELQLLCELKEEPEIVQHLNILRKKYCQQLLTCWNYNSTAQQIVAICVHLC